MWTIFKVLIEFVTTLLLFYVLFFLATRHMWDLSSLTRDQTRMHSLHQKAKSSLLDCRQSPWNWHFNNILVIRLIHGHGMSYLCRLQFLSSRSYGVQCTDLSLFLVKFLPKCFILFEFVDGSVFLISSADSLLLIHTALISVCWLCILPSCWSNLLVLMAF